MEGGPLAGHGSSTRAFEETVLESRPLAAHSTKSMKVNLNVRTAIEKKERQRAQARARKAKFRSDPEKLEREKKRRQ